MVDDLDFLGAGAEARQRIDEPLQPVVVVDDLLRRAFLERVRLVVDDDRLVACELQDVEAAVEQDTVVLERERPLGAGVR